MEDQYVVVIEGGSPWGFGIQGGLDFRSPLRVKMVTPGGRASKSGLVAGDYITSINSQDTKSLKHMQAQQLIKNSGKRVELTCVKYQPGLVSPALKSPNFTFSSPVANGNVSKPTPKSPVVSSSPITRPAPPPVVNGHSRQSSTGMSTSTKSSSPAESYEAKYIGLDTYCIDKSHPMPQQVVQECVEASEQKEQVAVTYDFPSQGESPQQVVQEVVQMEEINDKVEASYNLEHATEAEVPNEKDGESPTEQGETPVEQDGESPILEPVEAVVLTPKDVNITCEVQEGNSPVMESAEAVVIQNPEIELKCDVADSKQSPPQQKTPPMKKADLMSAIANAAERKRRESSTDSEDPTSKGQSSPEKSPQIMQKTTPVSNKPPKPVTSASKPPKPVRTSSVEAKQDVLPVAKQPLKQNPVATGSKEPGWYKQMFQDFQSTVEECFPGASAKESEYVYDDRGLKVRRDSLPKSSESEAPKRETAASPDAPVYVYDDRGLRVRSDSLSKVQRSTSPEVDKVQRPKSATTQKISVDPGTTTDDVLNANRKQTSYKTDQYTTDGSRGYWKQKDKDHQEFETKRRNSQEQLHVRQSSTDYTTKMTSMHPLLQAGMGEKQEAPPSKEQETEGVFNRIDASKLQGALENASMLNKLEQEGVATDLLPGVAKDIQAEKNKPKEKQLKPPPGRKGKALFNFDGQSAKELSFKKGDIVDLLHTVDDNWLQGSLGGSKGIFPTSYVQVLSLDEYRAMMSPEPKARTEIGRAKAMYDFQGQSERELTFSKDDELVIKRKIDDNWFEGYHGDKEGIFPTVYVQVL